MSGTREHGTAGAEAEAALERGVTTIDRVDPALESRATGSATGIAAALIAGGWSVRMGKDKAWLEWEGEPLWRMQLRKLEALRPARLLLSCREEQRLDGSVAERVYDPPENQGPLPALAQCLEQAELPVLALAVDMPAVTVALLEELVRTAELPDCGVVFRSEGVYEPLCAVYPARVLPLLREAISRRNFRLQDFVQRAVDAGMLRVIPLFKAREALFMNLNTPADLP